ncbi:PREDICTED: putative pumilio homolog 7, chloroplastic [Tarenaya hassleriana]|uniref:putative pumilio homolog 7, chloroplastic n=1 Tax=Tarenaya hassleriana TaxID=28532 RepID=UPI00053C105C|nr:PREDICTED: putative pumilio homolog 7, chloroplastic [Tarenaya hassleriana]XP_010535568.1 PREDICTED: putative pumilio homolog 7, chloroplastic [Tarenaya hassleriana]
MSVKYEKETRTTAMMIMNEFPEASSASSPSRSPPSPPPLEEILRTSSHSSNLHLFPQNIICGVSSSSRVSYRSSSDHSLSSSFSKGFGSSNGGSPFASPPSDATAKYYHASTVGHHSDGLFHKDLNSFYDENLADDLGLCENLYLMNIRDDFEEEKARNGRPENQADGLRSIPGTEHPLYNLEKCERLNGFNNGGFGSGGFPCGVPSSFGVDQPAFFNNLKGSSVNDHNFSQNIWLNTGLYSSQSNSGFDQRKNDKRNILGMSVPLLNPYSNPYMADLFDSSQQLGWQSYAGNVSPHINEPFAGLDLFRWGSNRGREPVYPFPSQHMAQRGISHKMSFKATDFPPFFCEDTVGLPNTRVPQSMVSAKGVEPFSCDDSLFMQGKGLNYGAEGYPIQPMVPRRSGRTFLGLGNTELRPCLLNMSEIQGYVYLMAKDQHGCRFLQRIFDEGNAQAASIIFNEVIDHVVELMMDPFGNYLMQKLLDVCTEEQRTEIILLATAEPGQLIRVSLNAYGTRVVQRLVETIKTRKQISLVKLALRPGFLELIKDLNGNHVIQRCLQCLSTEDNKFIFDAATKFCADIATHRHGCCVLQKCIAHSIGQQKDKLISEISRNSLLLAQDPFGNYAVQFVIELRVPSAIATMLTQLKGHYVQLSMQKFSSHVVERCLTYCPESRPQIIRELVSVPHFDQLLQDPFANFVIQAALAVAKGPLHASIVEVVRPHSILRNNPYCKRIFSRNLLKK